MSRKSILAAITTAILLLAALVTYVLLSSDEPDGVKAIGPGVYVKNAPGVSGLQLAAQEDSDASLPITHESVTPLAPIAHITSRYGSQLNRQITLMFQLRMRVFSSESVIIAVSEDGQNWSAEDAIVSKDGMTASVDRTHLSFFQPLLLHVKDFIKKELKKAFKSLTGGLINSPNAPKCTSTNRYVTRANNGPLLWCLDGAFNTNKREASVRVASQKRYPLQISYKNFRQIDSDGTPQAAEIIASLFKGGDETVIFPFGSAEFAIYDKYNYSGSIKASSTTAAQNLYRLYMATGILLEFAGILQSQEVSNGQAWDVLEKIASAQDCTSSLLQAEFGEAFAACKDLVPAIAKGLVGKVLGAIAAVGTFISALLSEITAYLDTADNQDQQSIMVYSAS